MINGKARNHASFCRLALAALLAGTSIPAQAGTIAESSEGAQALSSDERHPDIVVTAPPLFPDIQPERNLDGTAIESYAVSTVDELLAEIQAELGDDEPPLILINGERANGLEEIGAFPVEVLRNLQVLPRGSAVRVGGTSGQRVVSLSLNRRLRTVTATVAPRFATDGGWHALRGEGIFTLVRGATRGNVSLRTRHEGSLLESERGILQPQPFGAFALSGNVVGYPDSSGEIDPLLSALVGHQVTVAAIPGGADPSLANFVAGADNPATTDLAPFRTLRPNTDNYDFNGTVTTRLAEWLTSTMTLRLDRTSSRYLRGLPTAEFVLSPANPSSPFSNDVDLAFYGPDPLHFRTRRTSGELSTTFNARFGQWTGNLNLRHRKSSDASRIEREAIFGAIALDDSVDPFATDLSHLIELRTDRTSARANTTLADLVLTGPALALPAGRLMATVEGMVELNRLQSRSTFPSSLGNAKFRRNQASIRGGVDIPLTSRANGALPQLGDIDATAEFTHVHFSDVGSLEQYSFGLTWEPLPPLRLRSAFERTQAPAAIQIIGNPVIVTPDVRTFDPLTGETVDVSQIYGGNPDLLPQETKIWRIGALARLIPRLNLQLDAEYTDTNIRNFVSSLPDASAAIMLAFPDRFVRDSNGVLTTVDLRPVNFASDHEKRLRWGVSMNARIGGGSPRASTPASPAAPRQPTTYLQLTANHTIVFSDTITIRKGLDPVDLLNGGAIGVGGGRLRHQVDGTAAITSGGIGARVGVTWRGPSTLESRIGGVTDDLRFSPVFVFNLRAFADMKRFAPHSRWARGLRLSLDVVNVTNDRQKVRDSFGATPLQYQPGYRDPLGRTIEFEIRKVF